jgi:hypothetical protein
MNNSFYAILMREFAGEMDYNRKLIAMQQSRE